MQGAGLAEALGGFPLQGNGSFRVSDGVVGSVLGEVDGGECGQGLALQNADSVVLYESEGSHGVGVGFGVLAEVAMGGPQPEERLGFAKRMAGGAVEAESLLVVVDCLPVVPEAAVDGGQDVQRVSFVAAVTGLPGETEGGQRQAQAESSASGRGHRR